MSKFEFSIVNIKNKINYMENLSKSHYVFNLSLMSQEHMKERDGQSKGIMTVEVSTPYKQCSLSVYDHTIITDHGIKYIPKKET